MTQEQTFRTIFIISGIAMFAIRIYFQSKVRQDKGQVEIKEKGLSLVAGSIAALVTIIFGLEYIFFPRTFSFAYLVTYPAWVRWCGAALLLGGITLLGLSHYHLGKSFHSLVMTKDEQTLVDTGPYRWIRHPIYVAFIFNYVGGGLLAANLVLTFVPVLFFGILVAKRVGKEEQVLMDHFGQQYEEYMARTGRFIPKG
jgi:protein-S-isoprenylcysteine O-methyltransferase Ste14